MSTPSYENDSNNITNPNRVQPKITSFFAIGSEDIILRHDSNLLLETEHDTLTKTRKRKGKRVQIKGKKIYTQEPWDENSDFEVEAILDYAYCYQAKQGLYYIKWIGYSADHNSWEPYSNLQCEEKLKEFYFSRLKKREAASPALKKNLEVPPDPRTNFEKRSAFLDSFFSPPCFSELENYFNETKRKTHHPFKPWSDVILEENIDRLSTNKNIKSISASKLKILKRQLMDKHLRDTRTSQQLRLKEWEEEINKMEKVKITVTNDVDLEGPPRHMTYITQYMPTNDIVIPDDPLYGCECFSCELKNENKCCSSNNGQMFPYTKFGKLRVNVGTPIYECNKRCQCNSSCANRVVQAGRKTKLSIFRTDNGCGWGVKTLENIRKGSFIVEYVGEVINTDEAERRGKKYDSEGRTYLFDLDFNLGDECPYTVDAAHYGNVSHFINHSCDPNLAIFNVWIDCLDPNLPRLCLFANREIDKGEQLTFDYCQQTGIESSLREKNIISSNLEDMIKRAECKCGTNKCRKWLFER